MISSFYYSFTPVCPVAGHRLLQFFHRDIQLSLFPCIYWPHTFYKCLLILCYILPIHSTFGTKITTLCFLYVDHSVRTKLAAMHVLESILPTCTTAMDSDFQKQVYRLCMPYLYTMLATQIIYLIVIDAYKLKTSVAGNLFVNLSVIVSML